MHRIAILAAALLTLASSLPAEAQRGQPRSPANEARLPRAAVAAAMARQSALIDETMATVAASEPAQPTVYFVGFASFASEDVFIRETTAARRIVDERLGTRGRSILLVNHRDTIDDLPLATVDNLDAVLGRLGRVMSVDKDILVLFMTSHGVPGEFAVSFPGFSLRQVTPQRLAASLERSGIRHRVVILSSCYSGSFIPALRNSDTLVMTASRADRSSFGCSPQRAWTYFGDALFNRALKDTHSLTEAFTAARSIVARWEREQRLQPSEPQVYVGERIAPRLDQLAARLAGSAAGQD